MTLAHERHRRGSPTPSLLLRYVVLASFTLAACDGAGTPADLTIERMIPLPSIAEPSGVAFHPSRGTLFIVGDEGDLAELRTDGTVVQQRKLDRGSLEGLTVDPSTGRLYVAFEGDDEIFEFTPDGLQALRRFTIERTFAGDTVLAPPLPGIEGIAFRSDASHPHGGTFFVVNQGASVANDRPVVLHLDVPLRTPGGGRATILAVYPMTTLDLSGIVHDPGSNRLLVIIDRGDLLLELDTGGRTRATLPLPGIDQEGIALDGAGRLFVAEESGELLILNRNR